MNGLRVELTKKGEKSLNGGKPRKGWVVGFTRTQRGPHSLIVVMDGNKSRQSFHPSWFRVSRYESGKEPNYGNES